MKKNLQMFFLFGVGGWGSPGPTVTALELSWGCVSCLADFFAGRQVKLLPGDPESRGVQVHSQSRLLPNFVCLTFLRHELTCLPFFLFPLPLDYLLSNNYVNSIIVHKFDFSDEEIMAYYISFLKTLSLKLNNHTVHFFYNEVSNCQRGAFGWKAS